MFRTEIQGRNTHLKKRNSNRFGLPLSHESANVSMNVRACVADCDVAAVSAVVAGVK